jgi:CubicO group peptidase (beta-lactamase class C family)
MNRRDWLKLSGAAALAAPSFAEAAEPGAAEAIDAIVQPFLEAFGIPGLAVAVVRPDSPPLVRGYGVRSLGRPEPVGPHTQFAIASNTKAFLGAALALLVDEGRIGWEDPVVRHLPEFRMSDPAITGMMTVRDLLVHRSGLALGAGDLMMFPLTDHTAQDVLKGLPYLPMARGFRAGYAYDNTLYVIAGMLLERVSGRSWAQFITERLFVPLGMSDAAPLPSMARSSDHAGRHARLGPPVRGLGALEVVSPEESDVIAPAGGIQLSAAGAVPWLQAQLGRGVTPGGKRIWSEAQSAEMWSAQTINGSGPGPGQDRPERAVIQGYALGWGVADYRGRRMLSHSGGLKGQITRTSLLPEQETGLVVYSNSEEEAAISALRYALADHLLGESGFSWVTSAQNKIAGMRREVLAAVGTGEFTPPPGAPSLPLDRFVGRYRDPWYGDVVVAARGAGLSIDFTHTPAFKSRLEPFGPDAFRTRFARGYEDAVVCFAVRDGKVAGVTMRALSPIADFSFDFHDLNFTPV